VAVGNLTDPIAISGYRDFTFLGRGASSVVYQAFQEGPDRLVAVKVLQSDDPDDPARKRFAREKAIVGRLGAHPHVVQVFEASVTADGRPYISMQLYDGSLADRLDARGSLPATEAVSIMADIAGAVQAAHDAGILHRDIKPQNILLSNYGPGLADFGIAQAVANLNWSQTLRGLTPLHAAPEAFLDERPADARSDVWSLGSTLFTALAGRPPYFVTSSEPISKYQLRLEREPVPHIPRNDISPALVEVIHRALAKNPDQRFATAADMEHALRAVLDGEPGAGRAVGAIDTKDSIGGGSSRRAEVVADPLVGDGATTVIGRSRRAAIDTSGSEEHGGDGRRRWPLIIGAGAAVLVMFALGVVLLGRSDGHGPLPTIPAKVPSVPVDTSRGPTMFTADDHGGSVDLHWVDNSGGAASYIVFYRSVTGPQMSQQPQTSNGTTIHGLDPKLGYCFRLVALVEDKSGHRTQSAVDTSVRGCVATPTPPGG
jgi:hypothetical protein